MPCAIMCLLFQKEALVASDSMEHLESRMSGAQQLDVVVSGAHSDIEQLEELPGMTSCEITRVIAGVVGVDPGSSGRNVAVRRIFGK